MTAFLPDGIWPAGVTSDWGGLLRAIGSNSFAQVLRSFLCRLASPGQYISFRHEAMGAAVATTSSTDAAIHWLYFNDGPWRVAIGFSMAPAEPGGEPFALHQRLTVIGEALAAIARNHVEARARAVGAPADQPLSCLKTIQACLIEMAEMPKRELEVCARIIFGISTVGIAIDLGVCESTVKTYRKRAYQRLSIGSERELITWYLRAWADWRSSAGGYRPQRATFPGSSIGAQQK
jgi:DNA-binding CsgD family transcriptional regulator